MARGTLKQSASEVFPFLLVSQLGTTSTSLSSQSRFLECRAGEPVVVVVVVALLLTVVVNEKKGEGSRAKHPFS